MAILIELKELLISITKQDGKISGKWGRALKEVAGNKWYINMIKIIV